MSIEHDCDTCKYDPRNATPEMKDSVITLRGYPLCYHPDAYSHGKMDHEFWDTLHEEECKGCSQFGDEPEDEAAKLAEIEYEREQEEAEAEYEAQMEAEAQARTDTEAEEHARYEAEQCYCEEDYEEGC